jgi:hypothetical protein
MRMRKRYVALVTAAVIALGMPVAQSSATPSSPTAVAAKACATFTGPGDNLVHSRNFHVSRVSCSTGKRVVERCRTDGTSCTVAGHAGDAAGTFRRRTLCIIRRPRGQDHVAGLRASGWVRRAPVRRAAWVVAGFALMAAVSPARLPRRRAGSTDAIQHRPSTADSSPTTSAAPRHDASRSGTSRTPSRAGTLGQRSWAALAARGAFGASSTSRAHGDQPHCASTESAAHYRDDRTPHRCLHHASDGCSRGTYTDRGRVRDTRIEGSRRSPAGAGVLLLGEVGDACAQGGDRLGR